MAEFTNWHLRCSHEKQKVINSSAMNHENVEKYISSFRQTRISMYISSLKFTSNRGGISNSSGILNFKLKTICLNPLDFQNVNLLNVIAVSFKKNYVFEVFLFAAGKN